MRSVSTTRLTRVSVAATAVAALALPIAVVGTASADPPAPETAGAAAVDRPKQRTIVTTDGEIDDLESFVRYLYYANEVETEGIVLSSSRFHWSGNGDDIPAHQWEGEEWPLEYIDDYEQIYPNLIQHADGYPTPDELRDLYKIGNITNVGEMEEDTEGSDLIKEAILKEDPRTLFIQIWGGPNTTARALKSIQDEFEGQPDWEELQAEISEKVVLYNILDQDPTLEEYLSWLTGRSSRGWQVADLR